MEVKIAGYEIAGEKVDCLQNGFSNEELKDIVGKIACICYTAKDYDQFFSEEQDKSIKRANNLLKNGHHSPFDQIYFTLYLSINSYCLFGLSAGLSFSLRIPHLS